MVSLLVILTSGFPSTVIPVEQHWVLPEALCSYDFIFERIKLAL